ncbi:MAG: RluA family pseudouridine synthase [Bacteroidia bacterium]
MEEKNLLEEEQELYEHHRIEVDKGQAQLRIDKFLMHKLHNASRTKIQAASEAGNILVNGKPVKSNYKVKPLDLITILLPHPPKNFELLPENIPLNILYEDNDILIVNKPAGMVVHPAFGHDKGTLVNALLYHFEHLPKLMAKVGTDLYAPRPGLVHRIDKNTSGILIIAKNEIALTVLAKKFFDHDLDRRYVALVWGNVLNDEGTITGNVGRCLYNRKIMQMFPEGTQGKHAVTHYKVLERFGYTTLVECKLETGRTHQIRVHMKSLGHPLFNDADYGGDQILKGTTSSKYKQFIKNCFEICSRQALHARLLEIQHPATKKTMKFESELPPDMQQLVEKWRHYAKHMKSEE